jgi:hypothetical protein
MLKHMSGIQDHMPFSEKQIMALAQAMDITPDFIWIDPVTGAVQLKSLAEERINIQEEIDQKGLE